MQASVGGRRTWLGITALVVCLGAVETGAMSFLAHRFLPTSLAWGVDIVGVAALGVVGTATASVMWRRNRVESDHVLLVLGYLGAIRFPASCVQSTTALAPLAAADTDGLGPTIDGADLVLTAATGLPRVRIVLDSPVRGRRLWQRRDVTAVITSDPDGILAALVHGLG